MGAARHRGRQRRARKARVAGHTPAVVGDKGGLRDRRGTGLHRSRSDGKSTLPQFMAGVALATATSLAATQAPLLAPSDAEVSPLAEVRSINEDVRLAASILNIPVNLLIDIINIPYNETQAINLFSRGNLFSGPWAVTSASNVWGEDPGDMVRFMAIASLAIPFPALSGLDDVLAGEDGFVNGTGLGQLFWKYLAAEWPVDSACAADGCFPNTPVSPITGIAGVDQSIWNLLMLAGAVQIPVLRNFFQVPFSDLVSGYQFGDVESYDGEIYPLLGIPGTTYDPETGKYLMPWANTEYDLDLAPSFSKYLTHLMADPSTNPIKIPSLEDLGRAVQTFVAGMVVAFDPLTPGSPLCPGFCVYQDESEDYAAIVKWISDLWPGNETLKTFLDAYEAGEANGPTQANIDRNVELWRRAFFNTWSFSNEPLSDEFVNYGGNPSSLAPFFHNLYKSLGLDVDPLYGDTSNPEPENVGSMEGGVYALKGLQIPILFIFESDLTNREQAADYVGAYTEGVPTDLSNIANVHWWEPFDQVGVPQLTRAIGTDKTPTIFGLSRGAAIATKWKQQFNENPTAGVSPTFVLIGNPGRPNGGFSARINLLQPDRSGHTDGDERFDRIHHHRHRLPVRLLRRPADESAEPPGVGECGRGRFHQPLALSGQPGRVGAISSQLRRHEVLHDSEHHDADPGSPDVDTGRWNDLSRRPRPDYARVGRVSL